MTAGMAGKTYENNVKFYGNDRSIFSAPTMGEKMKPEIA